MIAPLLPWQEAQWSFLVDLLNQGRLPHALLLRGPSGTGKARFAHRFACAALCEQSSAPCGQCRGCRLIQGGNHPNLYRLGVPEQRRQIGIDQVRDVIDFATLTGSYARPKVVIVEGAEWLTVAAANTLLKTLEEPPGVVGEGDRASRSAGGCFFLLVSHRSALLSATVRSRCQSVDFPVPPYKVALAWLEDAASLDPAPSRESLEAQLALSQGAPLRAQAAMEGGELAAFAAFLADLGALRAREVGPTAVVAGWRSQGADVVGRWLLVVIRELLRLRWGGTSTLGGKLRDQLLTLESQVGLNFLRDLYDACMEVRRSQAGQVSLNEALSLESLAIRWYE